MSIFKQYISICIDGFYVAAIFTNDVIFILKMQSVVYFFYPLHNFKMETYFLGKHVHTVPKVFIMFNVSLSN